MALRALAARILPRVAQRGDAVAITGSVARGNSRADSDLDLWILGARSGRFERRIAGVSITLLCQRRAEAATFDNLCLYEVDDLVVLRDPKGAFGALQAVWRKQRRKIRAEIIRSTRQQLAWELGQAASGSALHRATFLRFACWRLACLRIYLAHGWRVPRLHLLREHLPPALRRRLDAALALPGAQVCRKAVRLMPAAVADMRALVGDDGYRLPQSVTQKLKQAPEEAGFLARRELVYELLPTVFRKYGVNDLEGVELLGEVAPSMRAAFRALCAPVSEAEVARLRGHLEQLRL